MEWCSLCCISSGLLLKLYKEKDGLTWKNEENKDKYLSNFVNLVKQSNDMA